MQHAGMGADRAMRVGGVCAAQGARCGKCWPSQRAFLSALSVLPRAAPGPAGEQVVRLNVRNNDFKTVMAAIGSIKVRCSAFPSPPIKGLSFALRQRWRQGEGSANSRTYYGMPTNGL